ncbi:MAG: hypothetical protein P4L99_04920 [Chthoniobacter sp.]|nr:hypothetical protein [Chthoniobacter sp.]
MLILNRRDPFRDLKSRLAVGLGISLQPIADALAINAELLRKRGLAVLCSVALDLAQQGSE